MKNTLLFITFFLYAIPTSAQSKYFENFVYFSDYFQDASRVRNMGDDFYVTGVWNLESSVGWNSYLLKINAIGDTLFVSKWDTLGGDAHVVDFIIHNDTLSIILATTEIPSSYIYDTYLMQTDLMGNIIQYTPIGYTQYSDIGRRIIRNNDGTYLVAGDIYYNSHNRPYVIKLRSDGSVIWRKIFTQYPRGEFNGLDVDNENGYYYFFGTANKDLPFYGDWLIIKTDTAGNIIHEQTYHPGGVNATDGAQILNGMLAADGSMLITTGVNYSEGRLAKINENFDIVWTGENEFVSGGSESIVELSDGSIVSGGTIRDLGSNDIDAKLVKVNPNGATSWERRYGPTMADYCYDMVAAPDGGYMLVGRSYLPDLNIVPIYIIKTNCMGLLTEPQAEFDTQTEADYTVSFFNQSQYTYPDSIDGGHYRWDFGDGSPPYICGQGYGPCPAVVQHTYAQAGTYTAQLTAIVCSDTAQVTQIVAAAAVGMPASVGQWGGIKVYPNPASESLSLRYKGTQAAQWVLYDMSGRICKQLTLLPNTHTQTLPITDLSAGVYYYTLQGSAGLLGNGKVVVGY